MNSLEPLFCSGYRASPSLEKRFEFAGESSIGKIATKCAGFGPSIRLRNMVGARDHTNSSTRANLFAGHRQIKSMCRT